MKGLIEGQMVHFVLPEGPHQGEHRPAVVVKVWNKEIGYVNLMVLKDGTNDYAPDPPQIPDENGFVFGSIKPFVDWVTSVEYSEEKGPRTWHWIEEA